MCFEIIENVIGTCYTFSKTLLKPKITTGNVKKLKI